MIIKRKMRDLSFDIELTNVNTGYVASYVRINPLLIKNILSLERRLNRSKSMVLRLKGKYWKGNLSQC